MATTTLWPTGTTGMPYGSFAGKAAADPEVAVVNSAFNYASIHTRSGWVLLVALFLEGIRLWMRR